VNSGRTRRDGQIEEAIANFEAAIKISPRDDLIGNYYAGMAIARLLLRDYDDAAEWATKAVRFSSALYAPAFLLSALGHAGKSDEARIALSELAKRARWVRARKRRREPKYSRRQVGVFALGCWLTLDWRYWRWTNALTSRCLV
jgi:tetratricopeptide (TPR) repeat protein